MLLVLRSDDTRIRDFSLRSLSVWWDSYSCGGSINLRALDVPCVQPSVGVCQPMRWAVSRMGIKVDQEPHSHSAEGTAAPAVAAVPPAVSCTLSTSQVIPEMIKSGEHSAPAAGTPVVGTARGCTNTSA
jgi:hypothetical protein